MLYKEYLKMKEIKRDTLYLIKKGNFFVAYDVDAIIINYMFKYKIVKLRKYSAVGFPINIIRKIMDEFDNLGINYEVHDLKDDNILYSKDFDNNNYDLLLSNAIYNDRDMIIDNIIYNINTFDINTLKYLQGITNSIKS